MVKTDHEHFLARVSFTIIMSAAGVYSKHMLSVRK
jgi:hypothetical protein